MKTIYLDHNIVRYFVKGFTDGFDVAAERSALEQALTLHPEIQFVVGDWNVVEAAKECARASAPLPLVEKYSSFLESLRPVFINGHDTLQRAEMRTLAFARWGIHETDRTAGGAFASHFSQIVSDRVKDVLVGFTLRIYLRHLATTPSSLATFDGPVSTAKAAIKACIDAYNAGRFKDQELRERTLRFWFLSLLPERDPEGKWIASGKRSELAEGLAAASEEVFRSCPALEVESILADLRAAGGGRTPKETDTFDLMHAVPALSYCDAFVSNDGPLCKQVLRVCQKSAHTIVVEQKLSEAVKRLRWSAG